MKYALLHTVAASFILGLFNGAALSLVTGGDYHPYTLIIVSLVAPPVMTVAAARVGRHLETRQLNNAYNQPAHGEER